MHQNNFVAYHTVQWTRIIPFVLLLTILSLAGAPAWAQRVNDEQGNRIAPGAELARDKFGNSIPVWVAYDAYSGLTDPRAQSATTSHKFKFMESALLVRKVVNTKDGLTYALLASSTNDETASAYRGWVDTRYILEKSSGERTQSKVLRKCMLVNRLSIIEKADKSTEIRPDLVPVTLKPETDAPVAKTFQLNNIFIVYRALDTHVLIGTAEMFNPGLETDVVMGWVPLSRISSWDTALALEWDYETAVERTLPGLIVSDPQVAANLILPNGIRPKDEDPVILFIEGLANGVTNRFEKDSKRYPILTELDAKGFIQQAQEKKEQPKLLSVGVFGPHTGEVDTKELKEKLNKVILFATHVDILFVVDDSEGMESAFPLVAEAIGKIAELFRNSSVATGDSRRDVRVAVSFYNDKSWSKTPFEHGEWVPLSSGQAIEQLRSEVSGHRQDAGGDNAEDVLEGIESAFAAAKFSRFGRRVVFAIGDMGDKSFQAEAGKSRDLRTFKSSVQSLTNRFVPGVGEPVEFYPIQIDSQFSEKPEYGWYEEQMKELVDKINQKWKGRSEEDDTIAAFARVKDLDSILGTVMARTTKAKQAVEELIGVSRRALAGNWPSSVSPGTRARLKSYEVAWKDVLNDEGFEVYEEGLLWTHAVNSKDKFVRQARGTVLVDEAAVKDLQFACQAFVNHLGFKAGPRRLDKAELDRMIDRIRSVLIRENGAQEELSKYFIDRSLPVRTRLFQSRESAGTDEKAITQEEVVDIILKSLRLKDIMEGKDRRWKVEVVKQSTGGDILVPKAELKDGREAIADRWFSMDGDPNRQRYVYLDLDREIP